MSSFVITKTSDEPVTIERQQFKRGGHAQIDPDRWERIEVTELVRFHDFHIELADDERLVVGKS